MAAVSLGAGHGRMLVRHLLPAAAGFLAVEITVLVMPAFIVAEATLSYCRHLASPSSIASWGTMLQEGTSNVRTFADFPWLLSPALAIFVLVLGVEPCCCKANHETCGYNCSLRCSRGRRARVWRAWNRRRHAHDAQVRRTAHAHHRGDRLPRSQLQWLLAL